MHTQVIMQTRPPPCSTCSSRTGTRPGRSMRTLQVSYKTVFGILCLSFSATGKLALYRKSDFFKFIDYAVSGWASVEKNSLAPFFRNSSLGLCVEHYRGNNFTRDLTFSLDTQLVEHCIHLQEDQANMFNTSTEWMEGNNFTVHWHALER